jgi:hypothetical protein
VQPLVVVPRDHLTDADVVSLLQDAPAGRVSAGCELIGMDLLMVEDLTDEFVGGTITRTSFANLHGTASLGLERELPWGSALIRPYLTMTDGVISARFNLGAYFTNVPERDLERTPALYDVSCVDILSLLADAIGDSYAVEAGVGYLVAVEEILVSRGVVRYLIDQSATATLLPSDRVWPFDEQTTWLTVVNDLLGAVGYAGVWSDWDGQLRCQPYRPPRERAPEWVYDTGALTAMIARTRRLVRDYTDTPNRWVFYRTNAVEGAPPVEGDGRYTWVNESTGDTSVAARGGRTITRAVGIEAADQASLVAAAQRTIDADMLLAVVMPAQTFPNPLHWHFDRCLVNDPAAGPPVDVLVTQWTLPLNGTYMQQSWTWLE